MPFAEFAAAGSAGIVRDIPPHELSPEAWSNGRNVRFRDGKCEQFLGNVQLDTSVSASPTYCFAVPRQDTTSDMWLYCSETDVYAFDGSANAKLTATTMSATGQNVWTSTLLSGIAVVNCGQGKPRYWVFPPNTGTSLTALPDWSASLSCKIMRSYKNYLVALNTTEGANTFPYRVRWSHAADAGAVPTSWASTNPAEDGGFNDIIEGGDQIVDGAPLVDQFMIYKENSTWSMRYIGGTEIFSFQRVYADVGLLSRNSIAPIGRRHFVVGPDDIYVHDGASEPERPMTGKVRKFFYSDIARAHTDKVFVLPNLQHNEVWTFYPTATDGKITRALVWNFLYNTWTVRETPSVWGGGVGGVEYQDSTQTWNGNGGDWDTNLDPGNGSAFFRESRVVLAAKIDQQLQLLDQGWTFNGAPVSSYLERRAIPLADPETMKYVRGIWPRITIRKPGTVNVYVGSHDRPLDAPTWYGPFRYDAQTQKKVDCRVTGKWISVKFEATGDIGWQLDSFGIDYDIGRAS